MIDWRRLWPWTRTQELYVPDIWTERREESKNVPVERVIKFPATKKTVQALNRLHSRRLLNQAELLNLAVQLMDVVDEAMIGDVRLIMQHPDGRQAELVFVRQRS